jgi:hypothetical protein
MAKHQTFTVAANMKVYFCEPYSQWQRGTDEKRNRLLLRYFLKTDLSGYVRLISHGSLSVRIAEAGHASRGPGAYHFPSHIS